MMSENTKSGASKNIYQRQVEWRCKTRLRAGTRSLLRRVKAWRRGLQLGSRGLYGFRNMLNPSANDSLISSRSEDAFLLSRLDSLKTPQWSVGHFFEEEGGLEEEVM